MATNTPAPKEETITLVRGSAEHKDYQRYQFGRIKDAVNSFETRIAVSGRTMLLIYVVYITVKAGISPVLPAAQNMPVWLNAGLIILDILMLALQVLGLEGSVPGLRHLADELESKGKNKEARTVSNSSNIAQWLLAATAIDIILQRNHLVVHGFDVANAYTNCLFVSRVVVIGLYLVAMAKLDHKGPRVISAHEAKKAEQEQIRMDNASIQATIDQAFRQWSTDQARKFSELQASLVLPEMAPVQIDTQALIQAVNDYLSPQIQAKFQAVNEELFRQKVCLNEVETQAKSLPELRQKINAIQAKSLPENTAFLPELRQKVQAKSSGNQSAKIPAQTEQSILRLVSTNVPANASRDDLRAEAIRLHEVEGLSSYAIADKFGKSAKTVQSWLSKSKVQAESEVNEAVN